MPIRSTNLRNAVTASQRRSRIYREYYNNNTNTTILMKLSGRTERTRRPSEMTIWPFVRRSDLGTLKHWPISESYNSTRKLLGLCVSRNRFLQCDQQHNSGFAICRFSNNNSHLLILRSIIH